MFEGSIDVTSSVSLIVRSTFNNLVIQHYFTFDSTNNILSYDSYLTSVWKGVNASLRNIMHYVLLKS
jgi:hypothetical protein